MNFELMAPCHFGLEACTKREIAALGLPVTEVTDGRVTFAGDALAIARANIRMRTTERILIKAAAFRAVTWDELFERTKEVPWEDYIPWDGYVYVAKAASIKSKLFSPRDFIPKTQKCVFISNNPLHDFIFD